MWERIISSQEIIGLSTIYNINNQTQGARVIAPYPYLQLPLKSSCFTKLNRVCSGPLLDSLLRHAEGKQREIYAS